MHTTVFERQAPSAAAIAESLRGTRSGSFWLEDAPGTAYPPLIGDITADIAVVGGGYCGLWTAILAKQENPDARVVLIEAKTLGWAASGRNGGFVEASLTHGHENGQNRWPDEMPTLERLGMQNLDDIESTIRSLDLDTDFERTGVMSVAVEQYQADALAAAPREEHSVFLDLAAVQAEVKSPTYLAGVWSKNDAALVHPAKLARELGRAAAELGVEIFEHTKADDLVTDSQVSSGAQVVTAKGTITAKRVALATNVFPSLLKRNRLQTVPVYDYALMTEPLTTEQLDSIGWANRQGLADRTNQFHYYRRTMDNRILFGGYDAIYHFGRKVNPAYENRASSHSRLASHFLTTFPQLEGIRFSHKWAGAVDSSTRFTTFFGTARQGRVAYAAGFTGLGVASTRFAGTVMLDLLAGRTTERTELEMVKKKGMPFPPEPIAWMGIQATRWSMDRADHNFGRRNVILKTLDALGLGFDS